MAAWLMTGAAITVDPTLTGQTGRVELLATWQPPAELEQPEVTPTIDIQVLIKPHEARIAEHTFIHGATDVSQPSLEERALVERLMALPPSPSRRGIVQPGPSSRAGNSPRAQEVPDRSIAAPKIPVADAQVPPFSAESQAAGMEVESPPLLLKNLPPTYPEQALVHRWEGTVLLRLHIAADGGVTEVELISSSGHSILDVEAIRSVRDWRFVPGRRNGQPVAKTVRLPIQFLLDTD